MNYVKSLTNIKAFVKKNKYIVNIIKICQLKHTEDWKIWTDDFGNKLCVNAIKEPSIILNQNINLQTVKSSDLYSKTHIKKLSSINKISLISIKGDNYYIWMIDKNNILRLCMYVDNILIGNQPVLISGIHTLKIIMENLVIEGNKSINSIIEPLGDEEMDFSWISSWPLHEDLLILLPDIIKKDCNLV